MNLDYLNKKLEEEVPIPDRYIARLHLIGALSVILAEDEWQQAVDNAVEFALTFRTAVPK